MTASVLKICFSSCFRDMRSPLRWKPGRLSTMPCASARWQQRERGPPASRGNLTLLAQARRQRQHEHIHHPTLLCPGIPKNVFGCRGAWIISATFVGCIRSVRSFFTMKCSLYNTSVEELGEVKWSQTRPYLLLIFHSILFNLFFLVRYYNLCMFKVLVFRMETLVILRITNLILSFRTFSKLEREGISYIIMSTIYYFA